MSDADSLLIFHRVSKHYGSVAALDEFSMRVEPGRVLGVLGRNGAGKSTMMGLIVGQLAPSSGTLQVWGQQAPLSAETRRRIGFAPQRLALYEALTARENLEVFAAVYGLFGRAARRAIEGALDLVDLSAVASRQVRHCSGGMQRRLNLAAALLHDADLILLDEPTAGVDIQSREKILEVVRESAARGRSVIYATHYIEEIQTVCDEALIIERGRRLAFGAVGELVEAHGGNSLVRYRDAGGQWITLKADNPRAAIEQAIAAGQELAHLEVRPPQMEDVFRNLVKGAARA